LASAKNKETDEDVIRLESKVICPSEGVPAFNTKSQSLKQLDLWLEFSHWVLSPFFKSVVLPEVMEKFEKVK
jgi:hypothetical protein